MAKASTKTKPVIKPSDIRPYKAYLLLERQSATGFTPGVLWFCDKRWIKKERLCDTLEPPWRDNKVAVSCIPDGEYELTKRTYGRYATIAKKRWKHGYVWEIANVPGRTAILIHWGNFPRHTKGCVLLGDMDRARGAVINSQKTYEEFWEGANPRAYYEGFTHIKIVTI